MKKLALVMVLSVSLISCMHMHNFEIQGHQVTQLRTWDPFLIGPSTVGFYEDVDGKLHVYQDSSGNILGQVAQAVGTGYAGERIGDGIKHQEPDSTNIENNTTAAAMGGEGGTGGEGGISFGGTAYSNSQGGNAVAGAISGSSSSSRSTSSSSSRATSSAANGSSNRGCGHRGCR